MTADRRISLRLRVGCFLGLAALAVAASSAYVVHAATRSRTLSGLRAHAGGPSGGGAVDLGGDLVAAVDRPHMLLVDNDEGPGFGRLTVVPLSNTQGPRAPTPLTCDRADYAGGRGMCLYEDRAHLRLGAIGFDSAFHPTFSLTLQGVPSRTRVAPDGRLASVTSFVTGDAYNIDNFSTRTVLIDLDRGGVLADLEQFAVWRSGKPFHPVDENLWGVTFAADSDTFYATLRTGPHFYLVRGSVAGRRMEVLRDGVECPSLSPDGRLIAFKARIEHGFDPATWSLRVLDVAMLTDRPVAETRNVDDQVAWLDAGHLIYAVAEMSLNRGDTTIWKVAADGSGAPQRVAPFAASPVVVR
jgi:hypothetical protein